MKKSIAFLFILFVLVATGCKKNQLKKPTDVSFKMDINRNTSANGKLVFTSGTILLASFDVEGEREEGDPIAFTRSFSSGLLVNFSPDNSISEIQYDIPQGVYTSLDVNFSTFDDFGGNTIVVNGIYTNNASNDIPVRYEFLSSEYFSISGEDYSGSSSIVLDKDTPANTLIKLDPIHWFSIITTNMMENADLVNVGGIMTILINESVNDNIYDLIADRIDESTEAVFN
ncbi:MAG: hypothetical protein JKY09_07365 [Crocinitomicaceae bacterium]|nr:hypothetical protein [Crocinitomicaceae bacterium]